MAECKRYYWLRLKDDFFQSKRIKKLRKIAGGDTYTIIYLKMQLLSLKQEGMLYYTGLEKSFAEELALDLDEDADNVAATLAYCASCGLIETSDNVEFLLPFVKECVGSETAATQRVRDYRQRQKALQCNADVTQVKRLCNAEIEKEKEKEIDIEKEKEKEKKEKRGKFAPPALEELESFISENTLNVDAGAFMDYYSANGWMVGKSKMKDWKAAARNWSRRQAGFSPPTAEEEQNERYRKFLEGLT